MTEMTTRREGYIAGLRALADFLEQHPDMPTPYYDTINIFVPTREEIATIARLTSWEKEYQTTYFVLRKMFGDDLRLEVNIDRGAVCRKVVTGTKTVPAQPEHTIEEYAWVCDEPILSVSQQG
jgi:hypothetical protein